MVIQLKASDGYIKIVSEVKRVKAIVLCEGQCEAEVLKALAKRIELYEKLGDVAVTDAEGFNTLRKHFLPSILALIIGKVMKKTKTIAVIVDANEMSIEERVRSFKDSIESRGLNVVREEHLCDGVWKLKILQNSDEIQLIVAVNGVFEDYFKNFKIHELEDHIAYLKLLEGLLAKDEIAKVERAEELVSKSDFLLINSARINNLEKSFKHIICVLKYLVKSM